LDKSHLLHLLTKRCVDLDPKCVVAHHHVCIGDLSRHLLVAVPEALIKMWVARVAQRCGIYVTKPLKDM